MLSFDWKVLFTHCGQIIKETFLFNDRSLKILPQIIALVHKHYFTFLICTVKMATCGNNGISEFHFLLQQAIAFLRLATPQQHS